MQGIHGKIFALAAAVMTATAVRAAEPLPVTEDNPTVTQNFNSMWDQSASTPTLILPDGWLVDRNLTAPRTVAPWSSAVNTLMYEGGVSLASNAKNGTWNFGSSADPSDRAVGGLTTTVADGTRGVSLMTSLKNDASAPVKSFDISYNIEKYRNGSNAAGFAVQLYYSADGEKWTSAGDSFRTLFPADSQTIGAETVPISVTPVENATLLADVAPGDAIYLAWNISVASGSSPNQAPGLALDDISVTARFADPDAHNLYVENATGKSALSVYSTTTDFYGTAPGAETSLVKIVNGVRYMAWDMPRESSFDLYVKAGNDTFGPVTVDGGADAYYCVSPQGITLIDSPDTYTGWVDPDRKPFVASGLYLRGEVTGWAADADWQFSDEGNGEYVLYDKTVSGQFKVSDPDWSASCNYGSNGSNISVDTPYALKLGTDDNISCGSYVFECKRIVLTIADGSAYLLLESNDDESDLTSVYMAGDFNSWNFMDTTGELKLDEADGMFKGRVTMKGGNDGLSHWRLYQRLGMGGAWGLAEDAAEASLQGVLVKGEKGNAAVVPATYDVTFSLTDGAYNFTRVESSPSMMTLSPAEVILTPSNPEHVKVLSLNNSLIHYNDQDFVFNAIADAMGADASWTKHTNLGKPLSYHWEEGDGLAADGTPGAKMLIRSEAWSHIILQEQSALPRTNPETFRANVKQWVEYIREYCPNPNAVILLPVNWAYSSDWTNFSGYNARFMEVYADVAGEFGAVVVPVASAYDNIYKKEGSEIAGEMFSDDRHPTPKATYMAACMEFAAILGIDPADITYSPSDITAEEAAAMRSYASEAWRGYSNAVNHLAGTVDFSTKLLDDFGIEYPMEGVSFAVNGGGTIDSAGHFESDGTCGTYTVTATYGNFEKKATVTVAEHLTEVPTFPAIVLNASRLSFSEDFDSMGVEASASLPEAWRIDKQTIAPRTLGTYATALTATTYAGGTSLPSNAKNGVWNFGADGSADRAPGGITTGVANGTRAINLYAHLLNDGRKRLEKVSVAYDVEKYRKGNNPAGFAVQLYYSLDGRNWTSAGDAFRTYFEPDNATEGYAEVPGEVRQVKALLPVDLAPGVDVYLAWNISVATGDAAQGAMALAIDNVAVSASLPEVPVTKHRIYVDNRTTWDALGLYAYGDSELFGAWPGAAPIDEQEIDGVVYQIFGLDTDSGSYNLIFNNWNKNKQLPDYAINANRDYWFRIDDNKAEELESSVDVIAPQENLLSFDGRNVRHSGRSVLRIYNVSGSLLMSSSEPTVDVDNLPAGIYIAASADGSIRFLKR